MLLGKVLAEAAMREDKHVTWFPSYGAEVRGGTAHCMVVISDSEIGSPYINKADTLIIMNSPSLIKFKDRLKNKGLLIINSSLVKDNADKDTVAFKHPFTDIALKLGNIKVANMVALGFYIAQSEVVEGKTIIGVIQDIAPADKRGLVEINKEALVQGMKLK